MRCGALSLVALACATTVSAIPTIAAKGSKFFRSDGSQYFLKGIAYQLTPADPLINAEQCKLDASLMQRLGANAIRVYHVDPAGDHKSCMQTFSDAGIYLWLDLDTFSTQIEPTHPSWNQTQYNEFAKVMDAFHSYDNLGGFFVGNEVLTTGEHSVAAPFVKAAARDMKAYRDSKGYRTIPIGYSAADIASLRPNLQNYLACGANQSEALDFFALNAYEWCGKNTYATSGYVQLQNMTAGYNIPIFFSETGCITARPRDFEDQTAIFGPEMAGTWSGSIIYEWIEETNNYGLISYGTKVSPTQTGSNIEDGFTRAGTPTPISPDFDNLSNQWKAITPSSISMSAYTPSLTPPPCPAYTSGTWNVNGGVAIPAVGASLDAAVSSSIASGAQSTGASQGTTTGTAASRAVSSTSTAPTGGAARPLRAVEGSFGGVAGFLVAVLYWF